MAVPKGELAIAAVISQAILFVVFAKLHTYPQVQKDYPSFWIFEIRMFLGAYCASFAAALVLFFGKVLKRKTQSSKNKQSSS